MPKTDTLVNYKGTESNCWDYGCEGICRCGEIYGVEIIFLDPEAVIDKVVESLTRGAAGTLSDCARRLVSFFLHDVDEDHFEVEISKGYYGEEIDGVYLSILSDLIPILEQLDTCETEEEMLSYTLSKGA